MWVVPKGPDIRQIKFIDLRPTGVDSGLGQTGYTVHNIWKAKTMPVDSARLGDVILERHHQPLALEHN